MEHRFQPATHYYYNRVCNHWFFQCKAINPFDWVYWTLHGNDKLAGLLDIECIDHLRLVSSLVDHIRDVIWSVQIFLEFWKEDAFKVWYKSGRQWVAFFERSAYNWRRTHKRNTNYAPQEQANKNRIPKLFEYRRANRFKGYWDFNRRRCTSVLDWGWKPIAKEATFQTEV